MSKQTDKPNDAPALSQLDKFKAAAREIGTDDDPERFKERVKRIGTAKPATGPVPAFGRKK